MSELSTAGRLLLDAFSRVAETVREVLDGLDPRGLTWRPDADANSIAWLVWHVARVEDDHVAGVATALDRPGGDQAWTSDGWAERFGLPFDVHSVGYGQTSAEAAQVQASADDLGRYYGAVAARTAALVGELADEDYDRVVDARWDPPVTAGVRLVSVVNDGTQHVGQAAYVRGLWERRDAG